MKKNALLQNLLILLLSLTASFIFAEIFLNIIGFSYPNFYQYDSLLGSKLKPFSEGLYTKEGKAYIKINSKGWRDTEHSEKKPPNTFRIAILGDSYAEAMQVDLNKTFWKIIEKKLNKKIKKPHIEVLNFGVSGYGTAQEYILLKNEVFKYNPDLIVLTITTGNDIRNNSKSLEPNKLRPFYILENGKLKEDFSFKNSKAFKKKLNFPHKVWRFLLSHSKVFQLINKFKHFLKYKKTKTNGLSAEIYKKPKNKEWYEAWQITKMLIKKICDESSKKQIKCIVAILSNPIQVLPDKNKRNEFFNKTNGYIFLPEDTLSSWCEKNNIKVICLAPILQKIADKNKIYFHGFKNTKLGEGHWNETGHKYAGEILARFIYDNFFSKKKTQ